ncbi:MAG: amidohydrolase family protein [Candidatus Bathyarchaeota archaeon]|nr:MAG: amidohydrolase family protein [Candidatus Bathyarchaeota archaeon]
MFHIDHSDGSDRIEGKNLKTAYTVFEDATVIDGTGNPPLPNAVMVVQGGKIVAVGAKGDVVIPPVAEKINVKDHVIMPGLIDAHIHFAGDRYRNYGWILQTDPIRLIRAVADARRLLQSGYTAVRDCGSKNGPPLKRAIEEGTIIGPRTIAARALITRTGGHFDVRVRHLKDYVDGFLPVDQVNENTLLRLADGPDDCRRAVREQLREGADFIKICTGLSGESRLYPEPTPDYTIEEITAMVDEAHQLGVKVASHAAGKEGIMRAVEAGVDTIEHGSGIDEAACKLMVEKDAVFVPTVAVGIKKLDPQAPLCKEELQDAKIQRKFEAVRLAHSAGVKIAAGSDFGYYQHLPLGDNALELEALVASGLSPMDAIVAATRVSAEALGLEREIGTLENGKYADLLVLNDNPLEDIGVLRRTLQIAMVVKNGEIVVNRSRADYEHP